MVFSNSRVLVAGGAGFIGANLVKRLLSLGARVRATLHQKPPVIVDDRIEYVRCDLEDMADCRRVVCDIDYVFMCAANTSGAAVIKANPLVHVTPNVVMNARMLEAAYHAKVRKFVWPSSNAAYPPTGNRAVKEQELLDGDPFDVYFGVAWMKRYTEVLCRMYSEKLPVTMPAVVVRPSNVYGPYDKFDFGTSHVTAALIRRVVERHDPLIVWGTGNDVRDLIYVDDFIDALILVAEKIDTYDPVNIGYGKGYSVREVLQVLLEIDGYSNARVEFDSSKPSMIPVRLIDTTKAETLLGFRPKTDLREGLRRSIRWYRESRGLSACA